MDAENFEERVQREVQQAVASSQKSLMDDISGLIYSKFSTFEARFSDNQKELSESQLSKIQQNILSMRTISLRRKVARINLNSIRRFLGS